MLTTIWHIFKTPYLTTIGCKGVKSDVIEPFFQVYQNIRLGWEVNFKCNHFSIATSRPSSDIKWLNKSNVSSLYKNWTETKWKHRDDTKLLDSLYVNLEKKKSNSHLLQCFLRIFLNQKLQNVSIQSMAIKYVVSFRRFNWVCHVWCNF